MLGIVGNCLHDEMLEPLNTLLVDFCRAFFKVDSAERVVKFSFLVLAEFDQRWRTLFNPMGLHRKQFVVRKPEDDRHVVDLALKKGVLDFGADIFSSF